MSKLGMYCLCYLDSLPKREVSGQQNVMCGSELYSREEYAQYQGQGYVMDNTGINISKMNRDFGSLTGLYWVWQNAQGSEFKGTSTYRLHWDEEFKLKSNRVYVPQARDIKYAPEFDNVYDQFSFCHTSIGWQLLYGLAGDRRIGISTSMIDELRNQRYFIPFHMFVADLVTFNRVCDLLFSILFEFHSNYAGFLPEISSRTGQQRFYDFFSERVLQIILINNYHFLGNVDIVHANVVDLPHKS